ncbi:uncharacterized protein LOC135676883 isoform X3 [Musa acuminata AAA Group]|uniref:uncharacterized protein LOC135676883 isoform X3 n=1 Tax=Musa acuminata AAA Group TaxID=214697 RepID=UPI0031CE42E0
MQVKSASPAGDCAFSAGGYQRVSPDILPLSHGRKPILNRAWKDETADHSSRNATHFPCEGKPVRARSVLGTADPSPTREHQLPRISFPSDSPSALAASDIQPLLSAPVSFTAFPAPSKSQSRHHEIINGVDGGGDVILQWGHNKRTRAPRAECRASGDAASAHSRQILKIPRRSTAGMAPPPSGGSYARGANLRTSVVVRDAAAPLVSRGVEERSGGPTRSEKRSPSSLPEKAQKNPTNGAADGHMNPPESKLASDQDTGGSGSAPPLVAIGERLNLDQFEWPKICISLSRKEKEDDFLAMKGTKLPQRPKKRAKNIDKNLQYCFPGMWLSDLTRGRYEVREKKCVRKLCHMLFFPWNLFLDAPPSSCLHST